MTTIPKSEGWRSSAIFEDLESKDDCFGEAFEAATAVVPRENRLGAGGQEFRAKPQRKTRRGEKAQFKTLRRMRGFLIETQGAECKVAFIEDGKQTIYFLPTDRLAKAGVRLPNQPFQMDEVEFRPGREEYGKGYIFRTLAQARDAEREPLNLTPELRQKLNALLNKDVHAED